MWRADVRPRASRAGSAEGLAVIRQRGADHGRGVCIAITAGERDVRRLIRDQLIGQKVMLDALQERRRQTPPISCASPHT